MTTNGVPQSFNNFQLSDGSLVNVAIMDTSGQERFRSLNSQYYKSADGILLVYDISNRASFDEIKDYYNEEIKEKCKPEIKVILLGNKTDLEEKREIAPEEGANFAAENNYMFMETSCLKNTYVADCFETLIELSYRDALERNIALNLKIPKSKNKKCC